MLLYIIMTTVLTGNYLKTCFLLNHNVKTHFKDSRRLVTCKHCPKSSILIGQKYFIIRRNSFFKYKYSSKVEDAVNKQIQAEQQAAQNYLNMAVAFLHPCLSRPGAGGFFMRMYEEELGHMQDFIQYQLMRGGKPVISGLAAPTQINNVTLLDAFKRSLEMEKTITELLDNLVKIAEAIKDYQCADYVTSVFLAQQMHSVNEMSHHVTKLTRISDNEHAIYHYDLQLTKSYPYSFKSKAPG